MLPGSSGFRWMPRKMAGIAMITIEASIVAIVMLSVVLDSATHRYRSGLPSAVLTAGPSPPAVPFSCPDSTLRRTLTQSTANHLLNGNYVSGSVSGDGLLVTVIRSAGGRRGAFHDVVHRGRRAQHEGGGGAEQRDQDGKQEAQPPGGDPEPGPPLLLRWQRPVHAPAAV